MKGDNCAAIIGFEYLSDLMLVANVQKDAQTPIFTSYASLNNKDQLPKNIFIFMPRYNYLADEMVNYLQKRSKRINNILLVTEINRDEMLKYKDAYSSAFRKKQIQYETFDYLESDNASLNKLKEYMKTKK